MKIAAVFLMTVSFLDPCSTPKHTKSMTLTAESNIASTYLLRKAEGKPLLFHCSVLAVSKPAQFQNTMPGCSVTWADAITGIMQKSEVVKPSALLGKMDEGNILILPKEGTAIIFFTSGYASSGSQLLSYRVSVSITCLCQSESK